jgi:hypothetical protein
MNQADTKDFTLVKPERMDVQTEYLLLDFMIKKEVKEILHEVEISIWRVEFKCAYSLEKNCIR